MCVLEEGMCLTVWSLRGDETYPPEIQQIVNEEGSINLGVDAMTVVRPVHKTMWSGTPRYTTNRICPEGFKGYKRRDKISLSFVTLNDGYAGHTPGPVFRLESERRLENMNTEVSLKITIGFLATMVAVLLLCFAYIELDILRHLRRLKKVLASAAVAEQQQQQQTGSQTSSSPSPSGSVASSQGVISSASDSLEPNSGLESGESVTLSSSNVDETATVSSSNDMDVSSNYGGSSSSSDSSSDVGSSSDDDSDGSTSSTSSKKKRKKKEGIAEKMKKKKRGAMAEDEIGDIGMLTITNFNDLEELYNVRLKKLENLQKSNVQRMELFRVFSVLIGRKQADIPITTLGSVKKKEVDLTQIFRSQFALEVFKDYCKDAGFTHYVRFVLDIAWLKFLDSTKRVAQAEAFAKSIGKRYFDQPNGKDHINLGQIVKKKILKAKIYKPGMYDEALAEVFTKLSLEVLPGFHDDYRCKVVCLLITLENDLNSGKSTLTPLIAYKQQQK